MSNQTFLCSFMTQSFMIYLLMCRPFRRSEFSWCTMNMQRVPFFMCVILSTRKRFGFRLIGSAFSRFSYFPRLIMSSLCLNCFNSEILFPFSFYRIQWNLERLMILNHPTLQLLDDRRQLNSGSSPLC